MVIIGILGGVGSGKSSVAAALQQRGAVVLDADKIAHQVLHEPDVKQQIRQRWGEKVFDPAGNVNRSQLGALVFAATADGPAQLAELERITHPKIGERIRQRIRQLQDGHASVVVLDAAVMVKAGWDQVCDKMIFVDAPRDIRWQRASQRGWSPEHFAAREAAQQPVQKKRQRADYVIDNSGSMESTQVQIDQLWEKLHPHTTSSATSVHRVPQAGS